MYTQQHRYASLKCFIVRAIADAVSPILTALITNTRFGESTYSAMDYGDASGNGGGISFDTFNKSTPPG